jgi:hypothetical protein
LNLDETDFSKVARNLRSKDKARFVKETPKTTKAMRHAMLARTTVNSQRLKKVTDRAVFER